MQQERSDVSLSAVCSADIRPIFWLFCLPCFYNASLASCSKISFSTGGVTKQRQSLALMCLQGKKISLFPPFDIVLVWTRHIVRWNVTVGLVAFYKRLLCFCQGKPTCTVYLFRMCCSWSKLTDIYGVCACARVFLESKQHGIVE